MLRRLLLALGFSAAAATTVQSQPPYSPYANPATNQIYNLLFCDEPAAFIPKQLDGLTQLQANLFSSSPNTSELQALAADASQDGRLRYLALSKLRELGQPVPRKVLLGVIVEFPLAGGLEVIAAFSEGGVRYLNQTGKMAFFEGVDSLQPTVGPLLGASQTVVNRIGPWDQPRRAPPKMGDVRLSFLVSDGLYFGEGPMSVMQNEALAGPVITHAVKLLQAVVAMSTK